MATTLDTLLVRIEADLSQLRRGMSDAGRITEEAGRRMSRSLDPMAGSINRLSGLVRGFGIGLAAAGATGLVAFAGNAIKTAADMGELADSIGLTTDQLQELQFAAAQTGVKQEQLSNSMGFFARKVGDARNGVDDAVKSFRDLGPEVEAAVASGAPLADVFATVANTVSRIEDPAKRASVAMDLFGRGGRTMVNMLVQGQDGLKKFADEAHATGAVIDKDLIKKFDNIVDSLTVMGIKATVFTVDILGAMVRGFEKASEAAKKLSDESKGFLTNPFGGAGRLGAATAQRAKNNAMANGATIDIPPGLMAADAAPSATTQLTTQKGQDAIKKLQDEKDGLEKLSVAYGQNSDAVKQVEDAIVALKAVREAGVERGSEEYKQIIDLASGNAALKRSIDQTREAREEMRKFELQQAGELVQAEKQASDQQEQKRQQQWEIIAATEAEVKQNRELFASLQNGTLAYDEQAEYLKILNDLKRTGVAIDEDAIARARELAKENAQVKRQTDKLAEATRDYENIAVNAFDRVGDEAVRMLARGERGAIDWRNTLLAVIADVAQAFLKAQAKMAAANAGGGNGGGGSGFFGSLFSSLGRLFSSGGGLSAGSSAGLNYSNMAGVGPTAFAEGGRPPVGVPSIVGERGMELFVPDVPGTIVPNSKLGSMGGTKNYFTVDMRGASIEAVQDLRKLVMSVNGSIESRAVSAVTNARQRRLMPA